MAKLGDKYIITLEDIYDGDVDTVYGIGGCDIYMDEYQLDKLQKYQPEKESAEDAYQRGINEAWDAARKIACTREYDGIHIDELEKIFGCCNLDRIFSLSAQEAMAKLKAHEQRNKYKAGDIVKDKDGKVYMCYGADDASVTMGNGEEILIIPPEFNKAYTLCYNVFDDSRIGDEK